MKLIIFTLLQVTICFGGINEENFEKVQKQIPEAWFECSASKDCMVVPSHCSFPQPLNKKFEHELYNLLHAKRDELKKCIDLVPPKWPTGAMCEEGKCVLDWKDANAKMPTKTKAVSPKTKSKIKAKP